MSWSRRIPPSARRSSGRETPPSPGSEPGIERRFLPVAAALLLALAACAAPRLPGDHPPESAWRRELAARFASLGSLRAGASLTLTDRGAIYPGRMALVVEKNRLRADMVDPFGRLVELVVADGPRIREYVSAEADGNAERPSPSSLLPVLGGGVPARELLALLAGLPGSRAAGIPWRWAGTADAPPEEGAPEPPPPERSELILDTWQGRTVVRGLDLVTPGLPPLEARYAEFAGVNGEPLPRRVELRLGRYSTLVVHFGSLETNVEIDDDLFVVDPVAAP